MVASGVPGAEEFMVYDEEDFKPIKRLGYGDMGTVFLAIKRDTGGAFALKVMSKEVQRARRNGYRAERELEILSALDNPFVPRLFTHFESKKNLFLVTDFCPGGDMNMLRQKQPERRFSENAARFYAAEVVLALEYLHSIGVVYRDLKPENVLIQESGHIMLTDFDLSVRLELRKPPGSTPTDGKAGAKAKKNASRTKRSPFICGGPNAVDVVNCATRRAVDVKSSHKSKRIFPASETKGKGCRSNSSTPASEVRSQSFVGTEEYVAPEMILGSGHGFALDWWTFGIFLYEMVYGSTPFKGRSRRDTFYNVLHSKPEFPGSADWSPVNDLISKLLVRDPSKRLGLKDIQSHEFFQGIDWELIQFVSRPPWVPSPLVGLEFMPEIVVDELLKQSAPPPAPKAPEPEMEVTEDDRRSSTASSTISDQFSDTQFGSF